MLRWEGTTGAIPSADQPGGMVQLVEPNGGAGAAFYGPGRRGAVRPGRPTARQVLEQLVVALWWKFSQPECKEMARDWHSESQQKTSET